MAVVVERAPITGASADRRRWLRPISVLRLVAGLAAIAGMALALYFGAAPVHITVNENVVVDQASGQRGSTLTATNQTQTESRHVTCVPYSQFDSSSDQNPACTAKVHDRLRVALGGLLLFVVGSAVWIGTGGDGAFGLTKPRVTFRSSLR